MDWHLVETNWAYYKMVAKERWGRISGVELDTIAGHREQLAIKIQAVYGISRDAAQMQLESWQGRLRAPG